MPVIKEEPQSIKKIEEITQNDGIPHLLQSGYLSAVCQDHEIKSIDSTKKRAISMAKNYEEFQNFVLTHDLTPFNRPKDLSAEGMSINYELPSYFHRVVGEGIFEERLPEDEIFVKEPFISNISNYYDDIRSNARNQGRQYGYI